MVLIDESGQLIEVSDSFCAMWHLEREAALNLRCCELCEERAAQEARRTFERFLASQGAEVRTVGAMITNGSREREIVIVLRLLEREAQRFCMMLVFNPDNQAYLEERIYLLEAVVEQTDNAMVIVEAGGLEAPIVECNEAFEALFELEGASLRVPCRTVLERVADVEHRAQLERIICSCEPQRMEMRFLPPSGHAFWGELSLRPVTDHSGTCTHVVLNVRDISEERQLLARMIQMDRMIAIGTLTAGVGHELNNPLAYVVGNIDFARAQLEHLRPGELDAELLTELTGALADAAEGADRMRQIISDMQAFSSPSMGPKRIFDLEEAIESAIHLVGNQIRHRAKLERHYDDVPSIYGDVSALGQLFVNLLVNAVDALDEGAEARTIDISLTQEDGMVVVTLRDNGVGMTPTTQSRIFDPFYTTKPVGQGTGLGLFIARAIVDAHYGDIEVDSRPNQGTTMRIRFPAAHTSEAAGDSQPAEDGALPALRVLLVDDEPSIGRTLGRMLVHEHDLSSVTSGADALEVLELSHDELDIIIVDLMMPQMDGIEFFSRLRERWPQLARRVIFVTGGAFTTKARDFLARVDNVSLEKPFELDQLRRAFEKVVLDGS